MKPKTNDEGPSLFIPPIKWRKLGQGTFLFVESKEPAGFRIECVTEAGQRANPTETRIGTRIYPAGRFFQASFLQDGHTIHSHLCDSMDEAFDACEEFRLHGKFPT